MLVGSSLLAAALLAPFEQIPQARAATAAALWLSNLHFASGDLDYFGTAAESNIFLHTWSLGVEEQFYLVWPLLVSFLVGRWNWQRTAGNWARLRHGMAATVGLCFGLSVFLTYVQPTQGFYLMPSRGWQFALGAFTVLALPATGAPKTTYGGGAAGFGSFWRPAVAGWLGIAMVLGAGLVLDRHDAYPGVWAALPSVGTALILAAGARTGHGVTGLLSRKPLQWLGRLSYSWYLWHWPVLILGATITVAGRPVHPALLVLCGLLLAFLTSRLV